VAQLCVSLRKPQAEPLDLTIRQPSPERTTTDAPASPTSGAPELTNDEMKPIPAPHIDERSIIKQSGHKTSSAFNRYDVIEDSDEREPVRRK
jgi:hypothetical protein